MAESISEAVSLLATRVGTECKSLVDKIGELSELSTTTRSDLVSALNELAELASSASGLSGDVGSGTNPVYLDDGTITASAETVGSAATPVYLSDGVLTACSGGLTTYLNPSSLGLGYDATPNELFDAMPQGSILFVTNDYDLTAEEWNLPSTSFHFLMMVKAWTTATRAAMWLVGKEQTALDYRAFYASDNGFDSPTWYVCVFAASATVGSSSTPVYLKNGVLTACSSSLSGSSGGDADGVSLANETDETEQPLTL